MTDELAPGVWWLSGTRGCNVFLVRADDDSFVLIDSGFGSSAEAIVRETRAISGDAPVTHVLLTHYHSDHIGAASEVARDLNATLTVGAEDCEELDGRTVLRAQTPRGPARLLARLRGRPPRIEAGQTLVGTIEIAPGIEAHHVPGHTPGSYCFVARRAATCFVGDLVIGHRSGLSRSLAGINSDDAQYAREMLRFALDGATDLGCPGHGYPRRGFTGELEALAREPREPWTLQNTWGRLWRLGSFASYVWRKRR